eukprot:4875132-Karenia_brevis.AAC.1
MDVLPPSRTPTCEHLTVTADLLDDLLPYGFVYATSCTETYGWLYRPRSKPQQVCFHDWLGSPVVVSCNDFFAFRMCC